MIIPNAHATIVRVFYSDQQWYVADNQKVEALSSSDGHLGLLASGLDICLCTHFAQGLLRYVADLRVDRVWFFAIYLDRQTALFIGTCALVPHGVLSHVDPQSLPDLDFSVHNVLAPCIPLLPDLISSNVASSVPLHDPTTLCYTGMYDGILMVNPITMFAVTFSTPDIVYLTPMLKRQRTLVEFLVDGLFWGYSETEE